MEGGEINRGKETKKKTATAGKKIEKTKKEKLHCAKVRFLLTEK